jgi:cytochrome P450
MIKSHVNGRKVRAMEPREYPFGEPEGLEFDPMLTRVREEEPLCRITMAYGDDGWLVTRYDDVRTVLGDLRFSRAQAAVRDAPRTQPHKVPGGIVDLDPPEHTRLRRVIAKAFTTRRVEALRPRTEEIAQDLIDAMIEAGPPADLVEAFSVPLPTTVICELLGVPYADQDRFRVYADAFMSTSALTGEQRAAYMAELAAYLGELVAARRRDTTDDLLSALVVAREEEDRLSEQEVIELATVLLAAGHETTATQISNFGYLLLTHPGQLAQVKERPELLPGAIEELLRFVPLTRLETQLPRYALEEVELSGGTVPAGDPVQISYNAANRDPRTWTDPERLDVTREPASHLAFGHGAHHCVGAQLARMELQVGLGVLLNRLPGLRLAVAPDAVVWKRGMATRGPLELPVSW